MKSIDSLKGDVETLNNNTEELRKDTTEKLKKMAADMEFIKDAVCGEAMDPNGSLNSGRNPPAVANIITSGNSTKGVLKQDKDSPLRKTLPPKGPVPVIVPRKFFNI